ncbi:JmjC domain-containing protein [Streptomyces sp. NPDC001393]
MAVTSSREAEETLRPPVRLASFVGDTDTFHGEVWGVSTAFLPSRFPPGLLTRAGIRSRIGTGLPALPCTGAVPEDTSTAPARPATRTRAARNVTFRLDHAEQHESWIADLLTGLSEDLGTTVRATLVLGAAAPVRRAAFVPGTETDGTRVRHAPEHLFVLQLDGQTRWNTADPETDTAGAEDPVATVTLTAGDALYLPPGHPYTATVRGGGSLHLLLTAVAHSARAVAARAVTGFLRTTAAHAVPGTSPATARHERLAWLRAGLTGYLPPSELAELLRAPETDEDL